MLKRSLTLKIYAYALAAFALLALATRITVDQLVRHQEFTYFQEQLAPQITFLANEAAIADPETPTGQRRLRTLQTGMSVRLHYYRWNDAHIPQELRTRARLVAPGRFLGSLGQQHWARVERDGQAIGALRIRFRPPFQLDPRRRWLWPLTVMGILALVLIPPLSYWVIRPLRRLESAVHRLADGDLETPVQVSRADELGRLAGAFDTMRLHVRRMLHEKERLLTDVSHELRGPLTRMALAQDLLEEDHGSNPYVARLRKELHHLDELTGELLSLSRNRQGAPMSVSAVDLAAITGELVAERDLLAAQNGVAMTATLGPASAEGNPEQLRRAIGNLMDNALKYTPSGGTLQVETRLAPQGVVITVRDTGSGISPDALPHVFEPFYRPDVARSRETGGTGLGLAIVKAIVDRHRGQVTVASTLDVGTTVTITLPASGPQTGNLI